jgi:hypothetical protein
MNIINKVPYELKQRIISYLPILNENMKIIHSIIKNYKTYFITALIHEYDKYYDDPFYDSIKKYIFEWGYIKDILSRIGRYNHMDSKTLIINVFKECTLKETQHLYLFITFRFHSSI